jgi:hypothetical protein
MKNNTIGRKVLIVMSSFYVIVGINYFLLQQHSSYQLVLYGLVNLCFGLGLIYLYRWCLSHPINTLNGLSKNILAEDFNPAGDELAQAAFAIKMLSEENNKAISFISKIGNGDLDTADSIYADTREDKKGALASALINMREQLSVVAEKEKERKWANEGLAIFSEILRANTDNLPNLCNAAISKLVKYLNANQAAAFILNDKNGQEAFLEMVACYAYERRKYLEKMISIGEGLLGQTFLEKETFYMTDIPKNYISITSGLGYATPTSLLLVPLKLNDNVLGILEIASFKEFMPYQIEFIEKIGEGIASAIATTKTNEQTSRLLFESQVQTQELKVQEEELRQNMEELQATQEASYKLQQELRRNEQALLEQIEEMNRTKQLMMEQEAKLKQSQEKSQKRSLMFKEKMEILDIELEGKNAQIKTLTKQLQELKGQPDISSKIESMEKYVANNEQLINQPITIKT